MLSQTVEYALRAMMYLASLGGQAVNCETISERTRVPSGYLSKVMRDLVCAKLVHSFRGPHGGFSLARSANDISLLDVVNAVDPIPRIQHCPLDNPLHTLLCPLHQRLDDALAYVERSLRSATLGSVLTSSTCSGACSTLFPPVTLEPPDSSYEHPH